MILQHSIQMDLLQKDFEIYSRGDVAKYPFNNCLLSEHGRSKNELI